MNQGQEALRDVPAHEIWKWLRVWRLFRGFHFLPVAEGFSIPLVAVFCCFHGLCWAFPKCFCGVYSMLLVVFWFWTSLPLLLLSAAKGPCCCVDGADVFGLCFAVLVWVCCCHLLCFSYALCWGLCFWFCPVFSGCSLGMFCCCGSFAVQTCALFSFSLYTRTV